MYKAEALGYRQITEGFCHSQFRPAVALRVPIQTDDPTENAALILRDALAVAHRSIEPLSVLVDRPRVIDLDARLAQFDARSNHRFHHPSHLLPHLSSS